MDNVFSDMYKIMWVLKDVNFAGIVVHAPRAAASLSSKRVLRIKQSTVARRNRAAGENVAKALHAKPALL
jgi:hypothetical protein